MNPHTISIDIETYSDTDLSKSGVYRYAQSDSFEILLFGYAVDGGEVTVIDLAQGEEIPDEILSALCDPAVTKWAFNASFERVCLSNWIRKHHEEYFKGYGSADDTVGEYLDPSSWRCTMVWSAYVGLPLSLDKAGDVLNLENQKMKEGRDLIRYFSVPCKPTKKNGQRTRNLPEHAPEKWDLYKSYNKRDVEVEMAIQKRLSRFPVPDFVWDEYHLDQMINDRGIAINRQLVSNAIAFDERSKSDLTKQLKERTGLENPNSVAQLKGWLTEHGVETDTLGKKTVSELIKTSPPEVAEVLSLRQKAAKSSVKKYQAMENAVCSDGRARGMFQFYGGSRTGRWAGRLIQLQNLPQNHMDDLSEARQLVIDGDYEMMECLYDDIPDTLSQLIRTAFVPRIGYLFYVADFSAIEARVLSYLADETWRIESFAANKDIYCASASQMFGIPVEKHGQNAHLRQRGKVAELALGYGGSVGALKAMGALDMGLAEDELPGLVDAWRRSNPHITEFWWAVDEAVKDAIRKRTHNEINNIGFQYESGMLFIELPSGRRLAYVQPQIGENQFGGESVTYMGVGSTKKWERLESYGPKFVENITQAISRDILANSMKTLRQCFICGHVHDELIIECRENVSLDALCEQMASAPDWLPGIVLRADGYVAEFYRKD